MKTEEKIKCILDAYEVTKEKHKRWFKAEMYGTKISYYKLEEISKCGLEVLDIETKIKPFIESNGYPDCIAHLVIRIRKKQKEGDSNG